MKRQKKKKTLAFKNAVAGYLFILPFILGFILFMVVPLISSLRMTFNDVVPVAGKGVEMTWVGIKNYKDAFTVDPDFVPYLLSELLRMVVNTPATLIFSFFIALLLGIRCRCGAIGRRRLRRCNARENRRACCRRRRRRQTGRYRRWQTSRFCPAWLKRAAIPSVLPDRGMRA